MYIYVLAQDGTPLMPTQRAGKVRRMLRDGRAIIATHTPFTIRLTYDTTHHTQPVSLGVDAGSKNIGLSATTEHKELYAAEIELRSDIVGNLSDRREARHTRRCKRSIRYRAPRFLNRRASKKDGWLDAIIFAVVVVTFINIFFFQAFKIPSSSMESSLYTGDHLFVSKLTYGPRVPQTPLTVPFTHNTIFGRESYSKLIQNRYRRLKGLRNVKRGDIVVFNFPNGDTVLRKAPAEDYYMLSRMMGRQQIIDRLGPVIVRPADKTDHYVKRCVAVPGDTLEVRDGLVWVNGEQQTVWPGVQLSYKVTTTGGKLNAKTIDKLGGIDWTRPVRLAYTGINPERLKSFIESTKSTYGEKFAEIAISRVGAVIGTYAGPGAYAVAFFHRTET